MSVKTAIVSTVKTSRLELTSFVHYHLNTGIDLIILFFDDAEDPLLPVFREYEQVAAIACGADRRTSYGRYDTLPLAKRQIVNATRGLEIARARGCDWLVHIDSDEFLESDQPVGALLAASGSRVLRFDIQEAVPENIESDFPYTEIRRFRRSVGRRYLWFCRMLGCPRALFCGSYFRGHIASKIAFRTDMEIESVGIHNVFGPNGKIPDSACFSIRLLHFDSVTFTVWKHKWAMRSAAKELNPKGRERYRDRQFKLYQRFVGDETNLKRVYGRIYLLTRYDKTVLGRLGMLRSFQLDPALFESVKGK